MRFHAKKAFAYRTDFSDSVPAAKAFLFLFFIRPKEVRQRFQRFPEHLHFLFSEFPLIRFTKKRGTFVSHAFLLTCPSTNQIFFSFISVRASTTFTT